MQLTLEPIGYVSSSRNLAEDDAWDRETASIQLTDRFGADALLGLDAFSHIEVVYCFHRVEPADIVWGARHPRGNREWPLTGIFAQRARNRPNRLGTTACRLIRVEGTRIHLSGLDAVDGTPVVDIKPVMKEFLPRGTVLQPTWSRELMSAYWDRD